MTNIYTNSSVITNEINSQQIIYDIQQPPYSIPGSAFPATINANANNDPPTSYSIIIFFQEGFNTTSYNSSLNTYFATYTYKDTPSIDLNSTGLYGTRTVITTTQTADRTHTIPDTANDLFILGKATQSLANKIINASCNTITMNISQLTGITYTLPVVNGNLLQYNGSTWINTSSIGPINELNISSAWKFIQNNPQIDNNYTTPTLLLQKYVGTSWITNAVFL